MEAGIDLQQVPECLEQQARGYQQCERQGDLRADESFAERCGAARGRSSALAQIGCSGLRPGCLQGGNEPEEDSGGQRDGERECQHASIDGDGMNARQLGGKDCDQGLMPRTAAPAPTNAESG